MLENRLRKLHNEEVRLQKQIHIANKHTEFADQVRQRRQDDNDLMNWHKQNLLDQENRQRQLNQERRDATRAAIASHKNQVLGNNQASRQYLKSVTQQLQSEKAQQRFDHQNERQAARDLSLSMKIQAGNNHKMNRQNYHEQILQANTGTADEHIRLREANEARIKQLEEIE